MMRDFRKEERDKTLRRIAVVMFAIGLWSLGMLTHWLWSLAQGITN